MAVGNRAAVLAQIQAAIDGNSNPIIRQIVPSFSSRFDGDGPRVVWRLRLGRVAVERDEDPADTDNGVRAFIVGLFQALRAEFGANP